MYTYLLTVRIYIYCNTTMKETRQHTLTGDSSIFKMRTVMNTNWVTGTVHKSGLSPRTANLVQKNGSCSLTEVSTGPGNCTCGDKFTFKVREKSYLKSYYCICRIITVATLYTNRYLPVGENPSCLQATLASGVPQASSHTVPHVLLLQISTLPSPRFLPPRSRISPFEQRATIMIEKKKNINIVFHIQGHIRMCFNQIWAALSRTLQPVC